MKTGFEDIPGGTRAAQCIWHVVFLPLISCIPVITSLVYAILWEGEAQAAVQMLPSHKSHLVYKSRLHTCKIELILYGLSSQHPP